MSWIWWIIWLVRSVCCLPEWLLRTYLLRLYLLKKETIFQQISTAKKLDANDVFIYSAIIHISASQYCISNTAVTQIELFRAFKVFLTSDVVSLNIIKYKSIAQILNVLADGYMIGYQIDEYLWWSWCQECHSVQWFYRDILLSWLFSYSHPLSKIEVFSFLETASLYLVYCLIIVYARCRFQKHKFFYFLKVETM